MILMTASVHETYCISFWNKIMWWIISWARRI